MTDSQAPKNLGWTVTLAAMGINLALGVLYAWSVIKKAIPVEWGWSDAQKALPYSIACIVFALMMVPAGRLQDRIGPRWVATAGGVLTGLGLILAGFSTTLFWYVVGFGVLAGTGIGLGYASATPPAVKWFPAARTGLITGIVVAGFGLASVYISPLANRLTGNDLAGKPLPVMQELIDAKAAPEAPPEAGQRLLAQKEQNIRQTLVGFGAGFLIVVCLLAQFLRVPPPGFIPPGPTAARPGVGPWEMLRSPLFYLLWGMFACGAGAGLMVIGNITTIAKLGKIEAGFILVALLAVGNASGRIVAGMLSDRIGRLWTLFSIFLFQALLMLLLRTGLQQMTAFVAVSMLLGFNYGACLSVFPSATKDYFGLKDFGVNYGLVFTSWGVGGLIFPLVAGKMFEAARSSSGAGSYDQAYLMAAGLLVLAAALTFATRAAERRHCAGSL